MTNIDRAAEHMDSLDRLYDYASGHEPSNAERAQALADAGLLATALPEPQVVPTGMEDRVYLSWRGDPVDVEQSARITEIFIPGESFPILSLNADVARSLGLRLIAAARKALEEA